MFRTVRIISASFFVLLLSAIAFAQGGVATGDLHITVKDSNGKLVTNATVTVQDAAKGVERTANSDGQGGYSARLLPPGTYSVVVEATGFTKVQNTGVAITVGGLVDLPVTLSVAGGKEVIEVSAQGELVETSRSSTTDTIGQRRIDNLPINGRNYINFTLDRFAGGSRQRAQHRRRAHFRPQHERPARPLEPGQRRRRRRH